MPLEGEWARADVFRVLRDISSNSDLSWPQIADRYDFDLESIDDPQGVVPIPAWHGVFEEVAKSLDNDAAMFDLFNNVDIGSFHIFDYLFSCAPTLRDACQAWVKFIPIRTNAYRLVFEEDDTGGYVEWPILEGRGEWRQNMFARIGWATQMLERALEQQVPPILIELATSPPKKKSAFQKKYQGRLKFGASHNRIFIPKALLARPLRQSDRHLHEIILRSAMEELDSFGQLESPLTRIANEVASNLAHGACTLPHISAKLGMSQRAVQRLLERGRHELPQTERRDPPFCRRQVPARYGSAHEGDRLSHRLLGTQHLLQGRQIVVRHVPAQIQGRITQASGARRKCTQET